MLRYLFVLDIALAILGASMVIGVGVSALLLAVHLDTAPEHRGSMNTLLILTFAYSAVTLTAVAGAWAIHKKSAWNALAQIAFALSLIASYFISIRMLANQ